MKNSQKGFVVIPSIIVLALLLIGGGTYVVLKNQTKQQTNNELQKTQTINDEGKQNNQPSNKIENWNSYTSKELGFTISYPSTYHVYLDHNLINYDENKYELGNSNGVKIQIQRHNKENFGYDLSTSEGIKMFTDKLNADRIKNDVIESSNSTPVTPFLLGSFKFKNKVLSGPGGAFNIYYTFTDSDTYYTVLVWGEQNDQETVNKILSTIKISGVFTTQLPVTTVNSENAINQYAYITKFYNQNGQNFIDVDFIELDFNKMTDGYPRLTNDNSKVRTFQVSNQVKIEDNFTNSGIGIQKESISLKDLETRLVKYEKNSLGKQLYIKITAEGGVVNIINIPWRP